MQVCTVTEAEREQFSEKVAIALCSGSDALHPARAASIRPASGRIDGMTEDISFQRYLQDYAEAHLHNFDIREWTFLLDLSFGNARAFQGWLCTSFVKRQCHDYPGLD